eukprot:119813_1
MGNKSSKIKQHQKRIKEENIELDLSVYNDKNNPNECNNKKDDLVASCSALHRISCCLKYYSILDIIHNINHHDMFNHFINDIYDRLLDDYIHLINHHSHQLSEINQTLVHKYQFVQCDISTCVFTLQHHAIQIDENNDKNESDTPLSFYKEKMNSLHFYLFHLQDSGLRITKTDTKENNENDIKENDAYFDAVFAKIKNMIFGKQHTVLEHSKPKFHLEISNINNIPTFTTNNTDNQTYMDELIQHISKRGINNDETYKFKQIIFYEEYDSESIVDDVMSNIVDDGNISNYMNNEQFMHLVTNYINTTQMTSFSFNIGFRFYYWDYYKHLKQIHDEEHMSSNVNV